MKVKIDKIQLIKNFSFVIRNLKDSVYEKQSTSGYLKDDVHVYNLNISLTSPIETI